MTIDEQFLAHSRLVRPFPARRLHDDLYQALAGAGHIRTLADALLMDPPRTAEQWQKSLHEIGAALESLADACDETVPKVERLIEQAPGDYRRAVEGLVATIRGLQQQASAELAA